MRTMIGYRQGLFVGRHGSVGKPLPQPTLSDPSGDPVPLDCVMGNWFVLLYLGGAMPDQLAPVASAFWNGRDATTSSSARRRPALRRATSTLANACIVGQARKGAAFWR